MGTKKGWGTEVTSPYAVTLWVDRKFRLRVVELEMAFSNLAAVLDWHDTLLEPVLFDRACEQILSRVSQPRRQIASLNRAHATDAGQTCVNVEKNDGGRRRTAVDGKLGDEEHGVERSSSWLPSPHGTPDDGLNGRDAL